MNLQAEPLHLKEATVTCIPRLRGGGGGGRRSRSRGGGSAQVSVLDRVRDVVLRLAMLSAATSTNKQQQGTTALRRTATTATRAEARVTPTSYADSYRSEAVDDCIEFLKRSAAGGGAVPAAAAVEEAASPLHAPPACATPCEP